MEKIDEVVRNMKSFGESLMPYNFPRVSPQEEEEVNLLKFREIMLDGYDVVLHFNKHDYGNHYLECFQILGKDVPFLPFCLTCKMAKKFLGSSNLSLIEVLKDNRKIYCWTIIKDRDGNPITSPYRHKAESCTYEDLEYSYVHPDKVNFY